MYTCVLINAIVYPTATTHAMSTALKATIIVAFTIVVAAATAKDS